MSHRLFKLEGISCYVSYGALDLSYSFQKLGLEKNKYISTAIVRCNHECNGMPSRTVRSIKDLQFPPPWARFGIHPILGVQQTWRPSMYKAQPGTISERTRKQMRKKPPSVMRRMRCLKSLAFWNSGKVLIQSKAWPVSMRNYLTTDPDSRIINYALLGCIRSVLRWHAHVLLT